MTREVRAELLSPAEVEAVLAVGSVVYLPLGSLEFHQAHLPIGLDSLNAHGVCVAAAERTGGLVLPTVYQGTGGGHGSYPWTIMMPNDDAIAASLRATLERLDDFGVVVSVLFTGHFADEQLAMIDAVADSWNSAREVEGRRMLVVATGVNRCDSAPLAPDHAGVFETTLLHALHPELVHLDRLPSAADQPSLDEADPQGPQRHDPANPLWGIFGPDPRTADLSVSGDLLEALADWLAGLVREQVVTPR